MQNFKFNPIKCSRILPAFLLSSVVIILLASFYYPHLTSKKSDNDDIAKKLVIQCTHVKEGDIVWIAGGDKQAELLEDIAIQVRKLGAWPLITISSDRMDRKYFDEVPDKYDSQFPEMQQKILSMVNVYIGLSYDETSAIFADVPAERFAALGQAYEPVNNLFIKSNIRSVNLGNGLNPTEERARQFNVPINDLGKIYWAGINTDYGNLEKIGKSLQKKLSVAHEARIVNPNGTDLTVQVTGRKAFVSDGIVSDEDLMTGGAALKNFLPAGEAFISDVPGTANGKIVVEKLFYMDKPIAGLMLTFKDGKIISMSAKSGLEPLRAQYDAAGKGKDEFGFIDIGFNPDVKLIPNSDMKVWVSSGMVTLGIGGNLWAGGQNESSFGLPTFLPGSTLTLDGIPVVKNGNLTE